MVKERASATSKSCRRLSEMTERKKILIVEDEKDIRDLVRYHLEQEGFSVLEAEGKRAGAGAGAP